MKKTVYYKDEINDDFAGTNIKRKPLDTNHKYINDAPLWRFFSFVLYRIIATPVGTLFNKLTYRMRIVGRKKLKKFSDTGYFLYGNHTLIPGDAFTPTMVSFPKKAYIVVNPDATSLPILGKVVEMLGAMPVPDDLSNMRRFCEAIDNRVADNNAVVIYPEAHIWPYYTKIRPFKEVSFKYPAKAIKPVFCFTTVFKKGKIIPISKTTVYIDGPFFPDESLSCRENQQKLRAEVFSAMAKRSELSDVEKIKYIKLDDDKTA